MKNTIAVFVALSAVAFAASALAHTPAETNDVVDAMLCGAFHDICYDNYTEEDSTTLYPNYWNPAVFFSAGPTSTWTQAELRAAFDNYLVALPERFEAMSRRGKCNAWAALMQCERLHLTNSVALLRPFVFSLDNNYGAYQLATIRLCVSMGGVNDEMTDFVERILTNGVSFAISEKAEAIREYTRLLRNPGITNMATSAEINRAVSMLYRNRHCNWGSGYALDMAFSNCIDGYSMSSNRLELSQSVLSVTNCWPQLRNTFVSITNEMLSSGRPLVQLDIEGELPGGHFE